MATETKWPTELIALAEWALRQEDLRQQFIHAKKANNLQSVPGIAKCIEPILVLAIYEAGLGKGFIDEETIGYGKPYPKKGRKKGNSKRADLAFKDSGKGKKWGYIEVKKYSKGGHSIKVDIKKLRRIKIKAQRWVLVYRVREETEKTKPLKDLLEKNFSSDLKIKESRTFGTITKKESKGICEICLAKLGS